MLGDVRIVAVLLFLAYAGPFVEARCSYMTNIPRDPKPDDMPPIEWTGGWNERPFTPAPEREDMCMDLFTPAAFSQLILIDEEIQTEIPIAKLNYQGSETPTIDVPLVIGSFSMLGPEVRLVDNEWFLYITERQDFEIPSMRMFSLNVRVADEARAANVVLRVVNIDDVDPIIHMFGACQVPEMGEPRLTECAYDVTDEDGQISTSQMTFLVESDRGDEQIFYMNGQTNAANWFTMTMTVGITTPLNFENNTLHIFQVTALDSLDNNHTVTLMVQVQNVAHRPPRWVDIFAVQQFNEKTARSFPVRAIDGDTGIDENIYYRLITAEADAEFFSIETIEGGEDGGILHVAPIDRDELEREVFQVTLVAYKHNNVSSATEAVVAIIIDDINDQRPEPLHKEYHITIPEETALTLDFAEDFGFHDRDLGPHAQYTVELESDVPEGAAEALYIAPNVGYQFQTFVMGTANHSVLDFENTPFQRFSLRVIATDNHNNSHVGVAHVFIELENWNDELPIFESDTQNVTFRETVGEGHYVATFRAYDLDVDDRVEHSLMGNAADFLRIDIDTGEIYVSRDDAFDYHRQNQIFVQVRADDTLMPPFHTATAQLIINLEDVNNTPPSLRLPRGSPQVDENVLEGFEISSEITATDPDTTAYLRFEIDWNTSYAIKQGQETNYTEFHGCADIETIFPDPENTGSAIGRVYVKEIRPGVTIDFEMFEMLYLSIRVIDEETEIGDRYDESTFTVTIVDRNDNPPLWADGSLSQAFRVREMADSGIVIGSVLATDSDGPLYNQVRYTIVPIEDTLEDLVQIDFVTGQITVDQSGLIDADEPPRWNLYYEVTATDRCFDESCPPDEHYHETPGQITIEIIDTNNKEPEADTTRFNTTVYIFENATSGDDVVLLFANDLDRDEIYNTVSYQINYAVNPRLRDFFEVERETGRVYVYYTSNALLDRDGDEPTHRIFFQLIDNFLSEGDGNRNQNETEVLVVLKDVNDNAPELPSPDAHSWSISEGLLEGERISPYIFARDRDEPETDNSRVGYRILDLSLTDRDGVELPELMFHMRHEGVWNVTGKLETAVDLRGYWGTYDIHIQAFDHGADWQMYSDEVYQLVINPYNFHAPVFVFPLDGTVVRLAGEWAVSGLILRTVDNQNLESLHATDEDGLEAGTVTFSISPENATVYDYFEVMNTGNNFGTLQLRQDVTDPVADFQVTIIATDGGTTPGTQSTETTMRVVFVPTTGDPIFSMDVYDEPAFFEGEAGLTETHQLPRATDLKNYHCDGDCHNIYYRIIAGNDAGHFALDAVDNVLSLVTALSREEAAQHSITVAASNSLEPGAPLPGATLTVHVTVREADPRPVFESPLYTAGIASGDSVNRELFTVHATHTEGAAITYTIDWASMEVDPSLNNVRDSAFNLDPQSGLLTLNFAPIATMQGMLEFDVIATDTADKFDTTEVKIYLVSALNRVFFIFLNSVEQIENNRNFIAQAFTAGFQMTCNIDQIAPYADAGGVASHTMTEMRAHFILDDIPVNADVIEELRSNSDVLLTIREVLLSEMIILQDFLTESSPEMGSDSSQITVYVLAVLSAILGFMVIVLLLTFIIRTRALSRRLEALSTNKYGSVDSGLNRAGLAAPGTNMYSVEGANPIWNETLKAPDFDAISDASNDSDLIGIEDMPQFRADYFPPEDVTSIENIMNDELPPSNRLAISDHSNGFGFNTSPFSTEFTNSQFRRL